MDAFAAVVLVCLKTTPVPECDERSAVEVSSVRVSNELGCVTGWQEVIARTGGREDVGVTTYLKTLCHRLRGAVPDPKPEDDPPPR